MGQGGTSDRNLYMCSLHVIHGNDRLNTCISIIAFFYSDTLHFFMNKVDPFVYVYYHNACRFAIASLLHVLSHAQSCVLHNYYSVVWRTCLRLYLTQRDIVRLLRHVETVHRRLEFYRHVHHPLLPRCRAARVACDGAHIREQTLSS